MARTIAEIQQEILAAKDADDNLSSLNSGSATAIFRLWARVTAAAISFLENIFDLHKSQVEATIDLKRPHTLKWYQHIALLFQLGRALPEGEIYYDNTGVSVDDVENEKIIAQAAAVNESGTLVLKVARENAGELATLTTEQYNAFVDYIGEVKDAGVNISVRNVDADKLKAEIDVYYDPGILNSDGQRIDGSDNAPVEKAAKGFLRALPFNGVFVRAHFVDVLQAVDGVYVPNVTLCQATRSDSTTFSEVSVQYQPFSGFLRFYTDSDLTINYISQENL